MGVSLHGQDKLLRAACRPDMLPWEASAMLEDYPDLLTVQHVHSVTGLSEQVIRREICEGRLPGCRIGRRLFVPKGPLVQYVTGRGGL